MTATGLFQKLVRIRLSASILYDQGRAQGKDQEALGRDIKPLMDRLDKMIAHGVDHDLPGVVFAMKALEHEIQAQERDAQFLIEKICNTKEHLEKIRGAMIRNLKERGVNDRMEGGYSVTLTERDGEPELTVR